MNSGSIYVELLAAALSQRERSEDPPSIGEASLQLVRKRRRINWDDRPASGGDRVTLALVDEVAYDMALVQCARCLGIDCDPGRFERPLEERRRLEGELASRGIPLA
jgi:hypothetical protein